MLDDIHKFIPTYSPQQLVNKFAVPDQYWHQTILKEDHAFGVHRLERARHLMTKPLPPHRKSFHDFFLITKGYLDRSKGTEHYHVMANTFCFMPAHHITYNALGSEDIEGVACHFNNEILHLERHPLLHSIDFLNFSGHPLVHIPEAHMPVILFLLKRMEEESQANLPHKYPLIQSYLIALLLELSRFATPRAAHHTHAASTIADHFKKLLHVHIEEKQRISAYAQMLSVTPNHLNKAVKQATGRTASDWIKEMLLLESKVLLGQSTLSIADIAYKLNFQDQSYFGRFFKKNSGTTPTQYRSMIEKSE